MGIQIFLELCAGSGKVISQADFTYVWSALHIWRREVTSGNLSTLRHVSHERLLVHCHCKRFADTYIIHRGFVIDESVVVRAGHLLEQPGQGAISLMPLASPTLKSYCDAYDLSTSGR
jgi:hypothetical protein